ncbi:pol polyprotein-like protein, partial [Leptotrombidium deliense]
MKLMEFEFTIVHKRGKSHCNVDCLSRYPVEVPTAQDDEAFVFAIKNIDVAEMQRREPALYDIIKNIKEHEAKGYRIIEKILYRTVKTEFGDRTLLCLPRKLINYVLNELHDSKEAGHLGFDKTMDKVRQRLYWKGMSKDVKTYIESCKECQFSNQKSKMKHGLMQQMPTASPFQIVAIDFAGPLPKTSRQNEYIVVLIDFGTRWIEAKALRSATADSVINFLQESVFLRHSIPKQLISDRGVQFVSGKFQEFLNENGVKHTQTSAYHPQSNGCVERQNRTLKNIMSKYVASHQKDWDLILPYAVYACNTSEQKSTKQTPFRLLYGRDPVFRIDNLLNLKSNELNHELRENIAYLREVAREEIMRSQEINMEYFNKNRKIVEFKEGDLVMQWKPNAQVGKADKLTAKMIGPYKIIRQVSDVNFEIEDIRVHPEGRPRKLRDVVHVDRLKLFNVRDEIFDELICEDREDRSSLAPTGEDSGERTQERFINEGTVCTKISGEYCTNGESVEKGVCDKSIQPIEVTVDSDHRSGLRESGQFSSPENRSGETSKEMMNFDSSDEFMSNLFSESSPLRDVIERNHGNNPHNAQAALNIDENEYGPPSLQYMGDLNEMHSSQPDMPILSPQRVYYRPASHNVPTNQNVSENQSFLSRFLFGSNNNVSQNVETE